MSEQAFLFPGQGSQQPGMLSDFAGEDTVVETFREASDALGLDLWELIQQGSEAELNRTENTQPALLASGVALWRLWQERGGPRPAFLAGHSLGEYTALACAGVLDAAEAVKLVRRRGQLMQEAVEEGRGGMAAILGLDDEQVQNACAQAAEGEVVEAVNFNAPGQVVIAGDVAAVDRAIQHCRDAGAKRAMPLPVSVPSHCALMRDAALRLASELEEVPFHAPQFAVINNVDVAAETDPAAIRDALVRQLYSPVRWVETVQALAGASVSRAVECGPGKVLGGLAKRIDRQMRVLPLDNADALDLALKEAASNE